MARPTLGTVISADRMNGRAVRLESDRLTVLPGPVGGRRWPGRRHTHRAQKHCARAYAADEAPHGTNNKPLGPCVQADGH